MHFVEQRLSNDCQRAAVASLLGLAYEDVPDLSGPACEARGTSQHWATVEFLRGRGLSYLDYSPGWATWARHGYVLPWCEMEEWSRLDVSGLALGLAWSPRTLNAEGKPGGHAVVLYDGQLLWDPHPKREMGIGAVYSYLIPMTPRGERIHV